MTTTRTAPIAPADVHGTLARHMLVDGYDLVLDLEKSHGRRLYDARGDRWYLDMFSCFATLPVGINHPEAAGTRLPRAAPPRRRRQPRQLGHLHRRDGGVRRDVRAARHARVPAAPVPDRGRRARASENALKAAFDWKVRRNFRKGHRDEKGHQVLHFREAFHGRSGLHAVAHEHGRPAQYQYFAKFDWPRVAPPKLHFPIDAAELERVQRAEAATLDRAQARVRRPQGRHRMRRSSSRSRPRAATTTSDRSSCARCAISRTKTSALLIFDEVQTGMGLTGRMWMHQHGDIRRTCCRSARRRRCAA